MAGRGLPGYIGLQLILSKDTNKTMQTNCADTKFKLFRQGFFTSMAKPFAVVFFAALFPQFIDPAKAVLPQLEILGSTYIVVDAVILCIWGWLGMRAANGLKRYSFGLINKLCGSLMVAAAVLLASKDLQPQR